MHVPTPEVPADERGSRGLAESQWVVDLHTEVLERVNVATYDARPSAWFETGKWAANGMLRTRVVDWLGPQFDVRPNPTWTSSPRSCSRTRGWRGSSGSGARPRSGSMPRPPTSRRCGT